MTLNKSLGLSVSQFSGFGGGGLEVSWRVSRVPGTQREWHGSGGRLPCCVKSPSQERRKERRKEEERNKADRECIQWICSKEISRGFLSFYMQRPGVTGRQDTRYGTCAFTRLGGHLESELKSMSC